MRDSIHKYIISELKQNMEKNSELILCLVALFGFMEGYLFFTSLFSGIDSNSLVLFKSLSSNT